MSAGDRSSRTAFRRGRSRGALVSDATTGRLRETPARIRRRSVLDARRARPPRAVPSSAATRGAVRGTPRGLVTRGKNGGRFLGAFLVNAKLGTRHLDVRDKNAPASRFRTMAEPWSVRRARYAGEALRPPRKTTSEDHDDDAFPANRDERSSERSRRAASAAPAPRLGPILALVTRRDRVQHVYCKRTNETVPCVAIRLADDTFDGLRVVLWRAHAAADVGAEHTRAAIVGTPHSSKRRSTEKNAVVRTDVSAARDVVSNPKTRIHSPVSSHRLVSPSRTRRLEHAKNRRRRRRAGGCGPARALERVPR